MRSLLVTLRALLRRGPAEAELDEELRYHLEREVERLVASGLSERDARLAASRGFRNAGVFKEEVRDAWRIRWFEQITQDIRFAARGIRRAPTFALTVIGTIALALGLNTT